MSDCIEITDVKSIKDPSFIKTLDGKQLETLCKSIRGEILEQVSTYGGHLSPNLGVVELTVALHRVFDFPKDKLIFDVGHQSYVHKILTGRSLEHLNEEGHTNGFQKIAEGPYDPYEAGHSSNSISAAEAFAIARDLKGQKFDVIAVIGDSSITNGLSFEGLNDLGGRKHKVIIVLNDNDMSISPSVGAFGSFLRRLTSGKAYAKMKKGYTNVLQRNAVGRFVYRISHNVKTWLKRHLVELTLFENLGFSYLGPIDGHNIKKVEKALYRAKKTADSVVVHVRTIKGKGYPLAENDQTGYWHGVTPFDLETGKPKSGHPGKISYSHFFADYTDLVMDRDKDSFLIVPATLRGSGLEGPYNKHRNRAIDVGIAEEHALTLAGALSLNGYHPIVSIYSTFLQRAYDELSHDCARLHANMTVLVERAGLVGKNGDTHQGIYDVGFLKTIPGVIVTMPSTKDMAATLYEESLKEHGIFAIRYPREYVDEDSPAKVLPLPFLGYQTLIKGKKKGLLVLAIGPAGVELGSKLNDPSITLIDPVYLNPIGEELIQESLTYPAIFLYDAYSTKEGFADSFLSALALKGYKGKIHIRTIETTFVPSASLSKQRGRFGLNVEEIAKEIETLLSK